MAHAYNPGTWKQRQEDLKFEGSLGYTATLSQTAPHPPKKTLSVKLRNKKKKPRNT
jgi:hypothetical protein